MVYLNIYHKDNVCKTCICSVHVGGYCGLSESGFGVLDKLTWVSICLVSAPLIIIFSLSKKCANLSGWIVRTFYTRDCITMLTLFKSIVLSRFD